MRQTNHYNLNLIDSTDMFSPIPLNENTELLEQALDAVHTEAAAGTAAETQARAAADTALASRVTALEGRKFAIGTYTGKGTKAGDYQTVKVGFTPQVVFVNTGASYGVYFVTNGQPMTSLLQIVSGGFRAYGYLTSTAGVGIASLNSNGTVYRYVAFC